MFAVYVGRRVNVLFFIDKRCYAHTTVGTYPTNFSQAKRINSYVADSLVVTKRHMYQQIMI